MAAYTDNPEANAESFLRDGYYRTGDLGTIQRDGYLKLIGRIKEIINKGGTKISPTDIENVALSLNSVAQAACFRIADDLYGDEIGEQPFDPLIQPLSRHKPLYSRLTESLRTCRARTCRDEWLGRGGAEATHAPIPSSIQGSKAGKVTFRSRRFRSVANSLSCWG